MKFNKIGKLMKDAGGGVVVDLGSECWAGVDEALYLLDAIPAGLADEAIKKILGVKEKGDRPIDIQRPGASLLPFDDEGMPKRECIRYAALFGGSFIPVRRKGGGCASSAWNI